jgi:1,4-alpha-glucan branching enzyme
MTRVIAELRVSADDLYLFNEGTHSGLADVLGAHLVGDGARFAVWAPNAERVLVVGDFNGWDVEADPLESAGTSGIWEGFVSGAARGQTYKLHIRSRLGGDGADKADPFAIYAEVPPRTASVLWDLDYDWSDDGWMARRGPANSLASPIAIYEVHLGSWMRRPDGGTYGYREIAPILAAHVNDLGFTHVELLPIMEHPFTGSWGYQTTGYFAPTSRFGTPQDFMAFVDHLHREGIGVILDWVPSHFPNDPHGLASFDGTHLFEHADPRLGYHPDWHSLIFNYGRNEVRSFLLSSAMHWLRAYHVDGLRVDAVASMLYLDYSRKEGEWIPNVHGGRENLDAISFLRRLNADVYRQFPDVQTFAEESTAWPQVSRPIEAGGLGFGFKWDMGWMHDTLEYMKRDPIHRRFHHDGITFRQVYAASENFVLPLSHDEVVHGKGSLLGKMPGDAWQRFANLRLLYGLMYATAGKKLLFMGAELAQLSEWDHDGSLDWELRDREGHEGVVRWIRDLNEAYRRERSLHVRDADPAGFRWLDAEDREGSTLSFLRLGEGERDVVAVSCNLTPVPRELHRVGVPFDGRWEEILNSDASAYGGGGMGNLGRVDAEPEPWHGCDRSLLIVLPPLACVMFRPGG